MIIDVVIFLLLIKHSNMKQHNLMSISVEYFAFICILSASKLVFQLCITLYSFLQFVYIVFTFQFSHCIPGSKKHEVEPLITETDVELQRKVRRLQRIFCPGCCWWTRLVYMYFCSMFLSPDAKSSESVQNDAQSANSVADVLETLVNVITIFISLNFCLTPALLGGFVLWCHVFLAKPKEVVKTPGA